MSATSSQLIVENTGAQNPMSIYERTAAIKELLINRPRLKVPTTRPSSRLWSLFVKGSILMCHLTEFTLDARRSGLSVTHNAVIRITLDLTVIQCHFTISRFSVLVVRLTHDSSSLIAVPRVGRGLIDLLAQLRLLKLLLLYFFFHFRLFLLLFIELKFKLLFIVKLEKVKDNTLCG